MTCKGTNCTASRENGFRHSSECLFDHARSVASGVASVSYGVTLDDAIDYVEWRGKRIDLESALSAHGQPVVDAAMIERAEAAWFSEPRTGNLTVAIQRMLTAALGADHE